MAGIFISYRRDDSAGHAGRLFDDLRDRFGSDRLIMDIDTIEPGVDFVEFIQKAVASSEAVLVVIGKRWLTSTDARRRRRLNDPMDFVRLEVETALERDIRIIPVLVQGAAMPREEALPESLRKLSRRQAHELSDVRWKYDVDRLIEILERVVGTSGAAPSQPTPFAELAGGRTHERSGPPGQTAPLLATSGADAPPVHASPPAEGRVQPPESAYDVTPRAEVPPSPISGEERASHSDSPGTRHAAHETYASAGASGLLQPVLLGLLAALAWFSATGLIFNDYVDDIVIGKFLGIPYDSEYAMSFLFGALGGFLTGVPLLHRIWPIAWRSLKGDLAFAAAGAVTAWGGMLLFGPLIKMPLIIMAAVALAMAGVAVWLLRHEPAATSASLPQAIPLAAGTVLGGLLGTALPPGIQSVIALGLWIAVWIGLARRSTSILATARQSAPVA